MKKAITAIVLFAVMAASAVHIFAARDWKNEYSWAVDGVSYCMDNNIFLGDENGNLKLEGQLTRSQAAKMLAVAFGLTDNGANSYSDTSSALWDYTYINAIEKYMPKKENVFRGGEDITREEFGALAASVLGYSSDYDNSLHTVFSDASKIDYDYRGYIVKAVSAGIIQGYNGNFRPKSYITRAEACVMIRRAVIQKGTPVPTPAAPAATPIPPNIIVSPFAGGEQQQAAPKTTYIIGASQTTAERAQAWARSKGASEKFIKIASTYWYYGELMGIRPELLYAQAALETNYGKYTGVVSEDMNNWAGIKVAGRNDDEKEAHQSFETPEEGARAHFNHIAAYIGIAPVGTPHPRYYAVKSISWAGTIKTFEELSGKWCPDPNYATKVLEGFLAPMLKY